MGNHKTIAEGNLSQHEWLWRPSGRDTREPKVCEMMVDSRSPDDSSLDYVETEDDPVRQLIRIAPSTREGSSGSSDNYARLYDLLVALRLSVATRTEQILDQTVTNAVAALAESLLPVAEKVNTEKQALTRIAKMLGINRDDPDEVGFAERLRFEPQADTATIAVLETLMSSPPEESIGRTELKVQTKKRLRRKDFLDSAGIDKDTDFDPDIEIYLQAAANELFETFEHVVSAQDTVPLYYRDRWAHAKLANSSVSMLPTGPGLFFPFEAPSPTGPPSGVNDLPCLEGLVEIIPVGNSSVLIDREGTTLTLRPEGRSNRLQIDLAEAEDPQLDAHAIHLRCSVQQPLTGDGLLVRWTELGWLAEWDLTYEPSLDDHGVGVGSSGRIDGTLNADSIARYVSNNSVDA